MVAHPRKTPSPGPLRSITPKAITPKAITPKAIVPEAVSPGTQTLGFRSLNLPVPIDVVADSAERPISITLPLARSGSQPPSRSRRLAQEGRSLAVAFIDDLWQVDDEWWRERPISRRYYQITTQDERRLSIFRDQLNGNWYWQQRGVKAVS